MSFHEVRFPTRIALGSSAGPERRTDIVLLSSGYEERNARWADSKRRYNAGYGVKSLNDLHEVISFYEERRGRLYGFRWFDQTDNKSCLPEDVPNYLDQTLGTGDGVSASFRLIKKYGTEFSPYSREITKPVSGTVMVAIDGELLEEGVQYMIDYSSGIVTFLGSAIPLQGAVVTAGFEFDVPVRFDTDHLEIDVLAFRAGTIPNIPIVEIRI